MNPFVIPSAAEGFTHAKSWDSLQQFPWIRAMVGVPQDPVHHAEGDVHIHTGMVLAACAADPEWQLLDEKARELVYTSAIMHDVAKPVTTEYLPEGRIGHPGHSPKGASMTRALLWELGYPFAEREFICGMALFHQVPYWAITDEGSERKVGRISLSCRADLLKILARADINGRVCEAQNAIRDNVEMFAMLADDYGCLREPMRFENPYTRFRYFRGDVESRHDILFDKGGTEVIIMCGLPGSGKDTWVKEHTDLPLISLDDLRRKAGIAHGDKEGTGRIRQEAMEMARVHLRAQRPFVWNATNLQRSRRKPLVDLCLDYGARPRVVYVEASADRLYRQNRDRAHPIPETALREMVHGRWEVPSLFESCSVEYWVDGEKKEPLL